MNDSSSSRLYMMMAAGVAWFGILLQCRLSLNLAAASGKTTVQGLSTFLGFFTVLTNILVCVALTVPLLARTSAPGRFFARPGVIAGVAVNIAFVAISYHFLLRHVWNPQGVQRLADVTLHYVVPVLFVIYWFVYSRTGSLGWRYPFLWSLYPMTYFIGALLVGEFLGTYPYHFIDVSVIGYRQATLNGVGLLFGFVLLGLLFIAIDRIGGRAVGRSR